MKDQIDVDSGESGPAVLGREPLVFPERRKEAVDSIRDTVESVKENVRE